MTDVAGRGVYELEADTTKLTADLAQVGAMLKQTGAQMESAFGKQAAAGVAKADKQVQGLTASVKRLVTSADVKRGVLQGLGLGAGFGAATAIAAGIGTVKDAIGGFIDVNADFEAAMNESLAIMGDLSDSMRDRLAQAARYTAQITTTSATEAAKAIFYLASAGLSAEASISALPVVARFAQAGMFDMAKATDLLTDAQSALGLALKNDAAANMQNMIRVSDVLTKANILSNATVEQFSESLTNRAAAALRLVNKDIEEGVAVLAAWAEQGTKGEEAGTRMEIVLRDLANAADKNDEAFQQMGIRVFDANGEMRNMADIVGDMERAFDGMSTRQTRAALRTLGFQQRTVSATTSLLGFSDAIREYERQLRSAGGATLSIAERQLESFRSKQQLLNNAVEEFALKYGPAWLEALKQGADFLRTEVIPAVEDLVDSMAAVSPASRVALEFAQMWERVTEGIDQSSAGLAQLNDEYREQASILAQGVQMGTVTVELARRQLAVWELQLRFRLVMLAANERINAVFGEEVKTVEELAAEEEEARRAAVALGDTISRVANTDLPELRKAAREAQRAIRQAFRVDTLPQMRRELRQLNAQYRRALRDRQFDAAAEIDARRRVVRETIKDREASDAHFQQERRNMIRRQKDRAEAADQAKQDRAREKRERREAREEQSEEAAGWRSFWRHQQADTASDIESQAARRRQIDLITQRLGVTREEARKLKTQADKTFGKDNWRVDIDKGDLVALERDVEALDGRRIDFVVNVARRVEGAVHGLFGGRPVGTQHGGWREAGAYTLVGERGPELKIEPRSGLYLDAQKTARILEGKGGSSLTVNVAINVGAFMGSHLEATRFAQSVAPVIGHELQRIGM
jgi:TP901 family phage tail tape measure protein